MYKEFMDPLPTGGESPIPPCQAVWNNYPGYYLIERDTRVAAEQITGHLTIASHRCFSLAMLAEYTEPLQGDEAGDYPRR